jgi:hypothetical protein
MARLEETVPEVRGIYLMALGHWLRMHYPETERSPANATNHYGRALKPMAEELADVDADSPVGRTYVRMLRTRGLL